MDKSSETTNWVDELVRIMAELRSEQGCPWDREQTHESLTKYLIEESYELIEAIEDGGTNQLVDELGDVLLQVIFHCQIGEEKERFNLQTVSENCCKKLIRRHPHVFGSKKAKDSKEVLKEWNKIKKKEVLLQTRQSQLDGVPKHLPALAFAEKVQKKASEVGFDWDSIKEVWGKLDEEIGELQNCLEKKDPSLIQEELGDVLFSVVNLCRFLGKPAEETLRVCQL